MAATEERIALITALFRYAEISDPSAKAVVPTAASEERPGYFDTAADAAAINTLVFTLKSDPAAGLYDVTFEGSLPVDFDGVTPYVDGADVAGLQDGRAYRVVFAETDGQTTRLTLWG